jgi:hypothetical protein
MNQKRLKMLVAIPQVFCLLSLAVGFSEDALGWDTKVLFSVRALLLGIGLGGLAMFRLIVDPMEKEALAREKETILKKLS